MNLLIIIKITKGKWATNHRPTYTIMKKLWKAVKPYCTWKMLPIALTLWFITNGWAYALAVVPNIPLWLRSIAIGYIAILYMPFTLEKVVIIVFAPIIYRWIYKEDFKGGFGEDERQSKRVEKS